MGRGLVDADTKLASGGIAVNLRAKCSSVLCAPEVRVASTGKSLTDWDATLDPTQSLLRGVTARNGVRATGQKNNSRKSTSPTTIAPLHYFECKQTYKPQANRACTTTMQQLHDATQHTHTSPSQAVASLHSRTMVPSATTKKQTKNQ